MNLNYVKCLNIAPMGTAWFRPQWNIPSWFIASMEEVWFYETLFFELVIVMVKGKKTVMQDTMSIKIRLMVYMKWIIVLPVNVISCFRGIWSGLYFFATFFWLSFSIGKMSILAKIWGLQSPPLQAPRFLWACFVTNCYS